MRRAELNALRWEHVSLDGDVPQLVLSGEFTKNKKDDKVLLHCEIVEELRRCKPVGAKPCDPVLTGKMLPSMWKMKRDLEKAGIPYEESGRRADFHSLRHTLATNLARQNVPPRIAMKIMRHSDIRLTMNCYTDDSLLSTADAVRKLPSFGRPDTHRKNTQRHPQTLDISCTERSPAGIPLAEPQPSKVIYPEQFWPDQARSDVAVQNCLARIRT